MANRGRSTAPGRYDTAMQTKARQQRNFHEIEANLPTVKLRPTSTHSRPSTSSSLLSYLGKWNPLPEPITSGDTVWLLDNTAYISPSTGQWQAEFVAAALDQSTGIEVSETVASVAEKIGLAEDAAAEATIKERLMPFVQDILPGRKIRVNFARKQEIILGPGGSNAISSDTRVLPQYAGGEIVLSAAKVPKGANGELNMQTVYAEPDGWGVISDIDDTIKITQTSDPIGILRSTFVSPATPVTGMPELYVHLRKLITPAAPFFYLSASPYNLYPFLRKFREEFFPPGTIILRDASWMNLAGLLSTLTLGTQAYKEDRMKKVNSWLPRRKMICIGDSTQSDPEAYGEIYRKHHGWIRLILIRKVTDIAAIGVEEKNDPSRFEKAFKGVPSDAWHVFENPDECYQIISDVVGRDS